ncbi:transposase helper protein, partial [mine drainage metagenome]
RPTGLYRVVDAATSAAACGQLQSAPAGFDELMPKTLATATVDRLLHHAHLCVTSGESVRLAQATAGLGVHPLSAADALPLQPSSSDRRRRPGAAS